MLPTKGRSIAITFNRSFKTISKNYAAVLPLNRPLEEELPQRAKRQFDENVKITTLNNGIKVASCDSGSGVSRLVVAANSSSRHEAPGQLGLNQFMKAMSCQSNSGRTGLRITREAQESGGTLEAATTREFQLRGASFLRTKLPDVLENIAPGITKPSFDWWEVKEGIQNARFENQLIAADCSAGHFELLHKVAYRSGLGNSLYCNNLRLGSFGDSDFEQYVSNNYVGNRITITATDVLHEELIRYVKDLFGDLPQGQPQNTPKQKYYGNEWHEYTANDLTYASLAGEGASFSSEELPTFLVLQRLLGGSPYVKWGSNSQSSRLFKAAKGVTSGPLSINALNISYSDSGLFGFHVITDPDAITPVMKAAIGQIASIAKGDISPDEVQRAKTQAKAALVMLDESREENIDDMLQQVAFTGKYVTASEASSKIDNISKENVAQAAKKILSGKPSLVVTGNTTHAPYVSDLI